MPTIEDRVAKMYSSKVQGFSAVTDWVGIVGTGIIVFNVANLLLIPARAPCPETFRSFPQVVQQKAAVVNYNASQPLPQTPLSTAYSKHFYFSSALFISFCLATDKSMASFKARSLDSAI
jgi:hypothetical protein